MTAAHSPQSSFTDYLDEAHPCRRCELPISEGHAYELGGDRWHMYCFSCSKCSKLLGTSSNFLVLGTGDLICSDCSYACNACGKKIDDLAILTGDQAYCSTCFCCRNCKKRIEDLKYARTSKGLFCMSCHEKLLERKRQHDVEKRAKNNNRMSKPLEKSLPRVPPQNDQFIINSAESTLSSGGIEEVQDLITGNLVIPSRSPQRSPQRSSNNLLDAPASLSPIKLPDHLSPQIEINDPLIDMLHRTPRRERPHSPLRQPLRTPGENRKVQVMEDLSSDASSTNILSSYITRGSPQSIAPPIPTTGLPQDEDFIDMNDDDEDEDLKYLVKPKGLGRMRHSDSIPTGLNIQGLPSFDDHFDHVEQDETQMGSASAVSESTVTGDRQLMSPKSPGLKKSTLSNITNDSGISRGLSMRSPKNFLNFRKHKKSASQSSTDYRISSPIIDQKNTGPDLAATITITTTPKVQAQRSPYEPGAALFTTPPIPENSKSLRKSSAHSRSRSDANGLEELTSADLELRSLRMEIHDLKLAKHGIAREIVDMSSQRDSLSMELQSMSLKYEQLKASISEFHSSKSSLDDLPTDSGARSSTSSHRPPNSANLSQPTSAVIDVAEQLDTKKAPKARFWKRGGFFNRSEMASSPSSSAISNLLSDGSKVNGNGAGNPTISAPIMRNEELDELGGNDNNKLKHFKVEATSAGQAQLVKSGTMIMSDLLNSSLEMRAEYESREIPLIVSRLILEIERRGLDSEGIYRKNGATSQTNAIIRAFNNLLQADTSQELENSLNVGDINAVSSALKRYLYLHLPEPVITMQAYDSFIAVNKLHDHEEKVSALIKLACRLPPTNMKTLATILRHLQRVEKMSGVNKMSFHNLAVVFAPTLARVSDGERELMEMAQRNSVTEFLLVHQAEVLSGI